jgi:hypothetical protein
MPAPHDEQPGLAVGGELDLEAGAAGRRRETLLPRLERQVVHPRERRGRAHQIHDSQASRVARIRKILAHDGGRVAAAHDQLGEREDQDREGKKQRAFEQVGAV